MIYAAILAGGHGSRMQNAELPKQFMKLGNKPIIIHTIEKFMLTSRFDAIYVGINANWIEYMEDLLEKYIPENFAGRIKLVKGGTDRNGTLFNVIDDIEATYGLNDESVIVTHDAVRPFVTSRMIDENIEAAIKYGAVDTVVPAVDTIVESLDGDVISGIPDRKTMYQGQTPQSFNIKLLKDMYYSLSEEDKKTLTDACKICVKKGYAVKLVEGEYTNLKITTPGDYKIAQAIVGGNISD